MGYGIGFASFATIAAPLLAGFSLTTIVTLSGNADQRGTRGDIAIAAFSISTVLMLFTLQAGIAATQYGILPDQRAAQYPEAQHEEAWMRKLREDQWRDELLAERLRARCRWTYNIGIIAFIAGLIALQIPSPGQWDDPHTGSAFRIIAIVAAVGAIGVEVILTFNKPAFLGDWLVPGTGNKEPPSQGKVQMDPIDPAEAQYLAFGGPEVQNESEQARRVACLPEITEAGEGSEIQVLVFNDSGLPVTDVRASMEIREKTADGPSEILIMSEVPKRCVMPHERAYVGEKLTIEGAVPDEVSVTIFFRDANGARWRKGSEQPPEKLPAETSS